MELVAPAGNFDKLRFAFHYGADAVYLGGKAFSLRGGADNFSAEQLQDAVSYAHARGGKVFLAANIYFHDRHFSGFDAWLREIEPISLDGMIVSDMGAFATVRERLPQMRVHVSTQANTTNPRAAKFYESLGAKRVVLARELTLQEIAAIRAETSLELEVFVHGAMCVAYSGRCLLSNYLTSPQVVSRARKDLSPRDANLGDCAQSCRWRYSLVEENRPNDPLPILEEADGTTQILSSKDLNLSRHLGALRDAGADAVKIEGRMKSVYYVANVARVYRSLLDDLDAGRTSPESIYAELDTVSHREYSTGFLLSDGGETTAGNYLRDRKYMGTALENLGGGKTLVRAANQIKLGDALEAITPKRGNIALGEFRLTKGGKAVELVQPNDEFILECGTELEAMDLLRTRGED